MSGTLPFKFHVRYFLSYAHDDGKLPEKLLLELDKQLGACKDYTFDRWQDTHILPGEKWHEEIQKAAIECDFGLLLVSPAFLSSQYIGEHELPLFVNGTKPCIPVGLCRIDFQNHDTKGLKVSQIFLHATPRGKERKYFSECTGNIAAAFSHSLFNKIILRLKKLYPDTPAHLKPDLSEIVKVTNNLPRLPSFFGRKRELNIIADALLPKKRTWGVLIDGPGGMGKTSLAIKAAEVAAGQFDRILFVSTKAQKLTPDGVVATSNSIVPAYPEMLNEIARLLGQPHISERTEEERPGLIRAAIEKEKVLLLLDNLENLDKLQQNLLFGFVSDLPSGCKAIVTSRRRTDVDARIIRLGKIDQDAALAYLEELAEDRELLAKATADERLHLYEETGGNPLLLRWIVGQLGRGSCRSIDLALELCRKAAANDPLEFIFGDLLETFTETETKVLAALTYFTQKIEVKFIAELADLSNTATQTALDDLANRALVIPNETDEIFTLVPMVADFLLNKRPEVIQKTGIDLEKRAYALIMQNGHSKYHRFPVLEAAWPSISPSLKLFLSGDNTRLYHVVYALRWFLNLTGRWDERLTLCQQAELKALGEGNFYEAGWLCYHAGILHMLRNQPQEILNCCKRVEAHWAKANIGGRERASLLRLLGRGLEQSKNYQDATLAFNKALELEKTLNGRGDNAGKTLNLLGRAQRLSGDLFAASRSLHEARSIATVKGDVFNLADILGNLADLALDRANWEDAEKLAEEALLLLPKYTTFSTLHASCSLRLATALIRQNRKTEALLNAQHAMAIYAHVASPYVSTAQAILDECNNGEAAK